MGRSFLEAAMCEQSKMVVVKDLASSKISLDFHGMFNLLKETRLWDYITCHSNSIMLNTIAE